MDNVNSPTHYNQGNIECIDYIRDKLSEDGFKGFCAGNIIKYITRYKHKNGQEDLKKASWYMNEMICFGCLYRDNSLADYVTKYTTCTECRNGSGYVTAGGANEKDNAKN